MKPKQVGLLATAGIVVVLLFSSFVIVDSGQVGVVRTLGAVQPEALKEGFHFKKPFIDSVEQIDVRLRKAENEAGAASKDPSGRAHSCGCSILSYSRCHTTDVSKNWTQSNC